MEKQILEKLISENKLSREISEELNCSQSTITYWLGKYNLKTNYNQNNKIIDGYKLCLSCNTNKPVEEYHTKTKDKKHISNKCKTCFNTDMKIRQQGIKLKCLEYKGKQCIVCNYSKSIAALEFHHIDPNQKEFEISRIKNQTLWEEIKIELDKCVILCANCHREVHTGETILKI